MRPRASAAFPERCSGHLSEDATGFRVATSLSWASSSHAHLWLRANRPSGAPQTQGWACQKAGLRTDWGYREALHPAHNGLLPIGRLAHAN
jgi:hypothetical protein